MKLSLLLLLPTLTALAQPLPLAWSDKPEGVVLYSTTPMLYTDASVPGAPGELIVAWSDMRDGYSRVMLQKFSTQDPLHPMRWQDDLPGWGPVEGLLGPLCVGIPYMPALASDGDGGAFVLWQDATADLESELRLLRVGDTPAGGAPLWPADLLLASDVPVPQEDCRDLRNRCRNLADENRACCADGQGGVWVVWRSAQQGLFLQHVDAGGALDPDLPATGLPLSVQSYSFQLRSDDQGNALLFFREHSESNASYPLYALGVRPDGSWLLPGQRRLLSASTAQGYAFTATSLEGGRQFLTWCQDQESGRTEIRGQLLDPGLQDLWAAEGLLLGTGESVYDLKAAGTDPAGPFYVAHADGERWKCRKLNAAGQPLWGAGVSLDLFENDGSDRVVAMQALPDGLYYQVECNASLYLQKVDEHGSQLWSPEQARLNPEGRNGWYWSLWPDGDEALFSAWLDFNDRTRGIRIQRRDLAGADLFGPDSGLPRYNVSYGSNPVLANSAADPLIVWSGGDSLYAQSADLRSGDLGWGRTERPLGGPFFYLPTCLADGNSTWVLGNALSEQSAPLLLQLRRLGVDGLPETSWLDVSPGSATQPNFWGHDGGLLVNSGGRIYVVFEEWAGSSSIRVQCFTMAGERLWGERGIALRPFDSSFYGSLSGCCAAPDGGVDIVFATYVSGQSHGYLQHVNPDGSLAYPENDGWGRLLDLPLDPWSQSLSILTLPDGERLIWATYNSQVLHLVALNEAGAVLWSRSWDDSQLYQSKLELDDEGGLLMSWQHVHDGASHISLQRLSPAGLLGQSWRTPALGDVYVYDWTVTRGETQQALVLLCNRPDQKAGEQLKAYRLEEGQPEAQLIADAPVLEASIGMGRTTLEPAPEGDVWLLWEDQRGYYFGFGWQSRLQRLDVLDANTSLGDPVQPAAFRLEQNIPNPFNPETLIRFDLAQAGAVRLEIFNLAGQRVRLLSDGELAAGTHALRFDARDDAGRELGSGLYVCQMTVGERQEARRMLLLR